MRFTCSTECTVCCTKAGWVNVSLADLQRMSDHTGIPKHEIFRNSLSVKPWVENGKLMSMGIKMLQPCKFLDESKCSIYEARPDACRIFPFNLFIEGIDKKAWPCTQDVKITGFEKKVHIELMRNSRKLRNETEAALPSLTNIKPYLKRVNEIQGEAILNNMDFPLALYLGLPDVMKDVFEGVWKELEVMG